MGTYKLSSQRKSEGSGSKKLREHNERASNSNSGDSSSEYRAKAEAQKAAEAKNTTNSSSSPSKNLNSVSVSNEQYVPSPINPEHQSTYLAAKSIDTQQSIPSPIRPEYQAAYIEAQSGQSPHQLYGSDPTARMSITSTPNVDNGLNLPTETTPLSVEYSRLQDKVSEKIPTYDALISKRNEYELSHPTILKAHTAVYNTAHQNANVGDAVDTFASFGKGGYSGVQEHPVDLALMVGMGALTGPAIGILSKAPGVARAGAVVTKIPVVGNSIARYGATAGLTGLYGFDLNSKINAPILTGEGFERDPTTQEKAERFGTAVSTEIIPFTIGAGLTASATRTKFKNPIYEETPGQYEVMTGFEIQKTPTGSSTKIKTDLVDEAVISLAERNRFSQVISQDERVLTARYSQAIIEDGITRTAPGRTAEVTLSKPLEVTRGQITLENEAILSTKRGAWELDITIPTEPSAGRTPTINQFEGIKLSEKVEILGESNTVSDNILFKQKMGEGSNIVDTRDSHLEYIRGRFTGEPVEMKLPELSGKTGKLQLAEKDGIKVLQEQPWTQTGVDQFRGIKLSEKVEIPGESNTYNTISDNILAKIEKRNPLMDIKEPVADSVVQDSKIININFKPDTVRRTIPKEKPQKIEVKDDFDIVSSSKTSLKSSSNALSKDIVAEQITGYRPSSSEVVGFSEVMGKTRMPGISFTPASFQGMAQSQGLNESTAQTQRDILKDIQTEGTEQTQALDFIQDTLPRKTTGQKQKQATSNSIPQISRSIAAMEMPLLEIPTFPKYNKNSKSKKTKAPILGSGKEKNLFNKYGNPLMLPDNIGRFL